MKPSIVKERDEEEHELINKQGEELVFEDPFVDEYEEEDVMEDRGERLTASEEEDPKVRRGSDGTSVGRRRDLVDSSAYKMFHTLRPEWPSLSFDILKDN